MSNHILITTSDDDAGILVVTLVDDQSGHSRDLLNYQTNGDPIIIEADEFHLASGVGRSVGLRLIP